MKQLKLQNEQYKRLENKFRDWLQTLGYAESSVYSMPYTLREFLHFLEKNHINDLEQITHKYITGYFHHLETRPNQRRPGGLSINHQIKHLQALRNFGKYLKQTNQGILEVDIPLQQEQRKNISVLTKAEIKALYEATPDNPLGLRDKAMLAIFYGCGLRRSEGTGLDVEDILLKKNQIYVRKGKQYRERYVPISEGVRDTIVNYLETARPAFLKDQEHPAFFISKFSRRIEGQSLSIRLKVLKRQAGIDKEIGLHKLRHSIATHLLQSGMKLSYIARFLGHNSLESTQIYTHIVNEL